MPAAPSEWARPYVAKLLLGETVALRPRGHSMLPLIKSGQLCTVAPVGPVLEVGDVVLCRVRGIFYMHLVHGVDRMKKKYLIGNNRGRLNGWVNEGHVYGRLVKVED